MKVVVAGATGFIGQALVRALLERGDEVLALSRSAERARQALPPSVEAVEWNPESSGPWMDTVGQADGVLNFAGEQVVQVTRPWTARERQRILMSRVGPTDAIVDALRRTEPRPRVLVNASAMGYYGSQGETILTETSPPGNDFLAGVVKQWEAAAQPAEKLGVRLVLLRSGIVLGRDGGQLPLMALPFKLFAGGRMGAKGQWFSWIHIDDEVGLILSALDRDAYQGPVNATAPNPVTIDEFSSELGRALHRPSWVPLLDIGMRLGLGKRAEAVLASERVLPEAALAAGYQFRFPTVRGALQAIYG